jgi:hypothetical protein
MVGDGSLRRHRPHPCGIRLSGGTRLARGSRDPAYRRISAGLSHSVPKRRRHRIEGWNRDHTLLIFKRFTRSAIEARVLYYRHEQGALRCRSSQLTAEFTSRPYRVRATELVVSINLESGRRAQVRISSSGSQLVPEPVSAPCERPVPEATTRNAAPNRRLQRALGSMER